jgi:hypothetical protein
LAGFIRFETALKHPSACSGVVQLRIEFVRLQGDEDISEDDNDDEEEDGDEQNVLEMVLRRNSFDIGQVRLRGGSPIYLLLVFLLLHFFHGLSSLNCCTLVQSSTVHMAQGCYHILNN